MDTTTQCETCQLDAKRNAGETLTPAESAHWSMWGCTCDPEDEAAALDFIATVTR